MKRTLELGALSPLPSEQLAGMFTAAQLAGFDTLAMCITTLHLKCLLTEAESHRARQRLLRYIQKRARASAPSASSAAKNSDSAKNQTPRDEFTKKPHARRAMAVHEGSGPKFIETRLANRPS